MQTDDLTLWQASADAWVECQGERGDQSRQFLDPFVWEAIGPVQDLEILDIGCGEGRFGRELKKKGAKVSGLEPTPGFFNRCFFPVVSGISEILPFQSETFDLVLFYLVLIDIEHFEKAIQEAARVLKPNGRLVAVNLTPISTTGADPFWERDAKGNKLARRVQFYGIPQGQVYEWAGMRIRNYHRPLRDYMRAYLAAGLRLELYDEPMDAAVISDSVMSPNFDLMVWRKP